MSSSSSPSITPEIDVLFGILKRNNKSIRIRKRTSTNAVSKKNNNAKDLKSDSTKSSPNHHNLEETNDNSNANSGVLGFFRNSFSSSVAKTTNSQQSSTQKDATSSATNEKKKKKVRPPLDEDVDLEKFPDSALYNSLHIQKLKAEISNESTINAVAEEAPLRKELWHGVVEQPLLRGEAWRLTLGISPATHARRLKDAQRQILEYRDYLKLYYYCHQSSSGVGSRANSARHSRQNSNSGEHHSNNINNNHHHPHQIIEGNLPSCMFPSVDSPAPSLDRRTKTERDILGQLAIDLPRHKAALYFLPQLVERLRRCLYIWALRNPAVGYVQGMDDVVVVMFIAFLDEAFSMLEPWNKLMIKEKSTNSNSNSFSDAELTKMWLNLRSEMKGESKPNNSSSISSFGDGTRPWTEDREDLEDMLNLLPPCALDVVECDTYNCGGRFLSWGMDRYTFGQPGVISCVDKISMGLKFFDPELHHHLREVCNVEFKTFAYKYVHLLLVRDLGQWLSMRLFDSLLSAGSSQCWELFSCFCIAWLISVRKKILYEVPPDEALFFMQEPTKIGMGGKNGSKEGKSALRWMEDLLSRSYLLMLQRKQQQQQQKPIRLK